MFKRSLSLLVLLFTISYVAAIGPSWYSCDPATCIPANNCMCPSNQSPIAPQDTPQFMLITHDDATNALTTNIMRSIVDGIKNPNGCNVPVTFFTTQQGSDCAKVKEMFEMNHEIAAHTVNHLELRPELPDMEKQILGVRDWLAAECGIPKDKIRGQRNPYLTHNPKTREIIAKAGFLYDSTINEYVGYGSTTTPNIENRLFPYTFDNGVVQDCAWNGIYSECNEKERYPRMWEIPMWDLFKDPSKKYEAKGNAITMDPPDPFNFLKMHLDITYNNNRAPLPIFLHSTWGNYSINVPDMVADTRKFVEYAVQQEGVWAVTMSQLIDWLKNPVPWSEYNYDCTPVELSGPPKAEKCRTWTVEPNDTLIDIAAKTGTVDMNDIITLNNMNTALSIQLGQKLKIPPYDDSCPTDGASINQGGSGIPITSTPPPTVDNNDLIVENESEKPVIVPPPTVQATCRKHVVKMGEILIALANTYGITAEEIVEANKSVLPSMNTGLQLGMQLNIPPFPECCNNDSCPKPVTGDRIEVLMKVAGLNPKDLKPEVINRFNAMIAKELSVEDAATVKFVSLSNPAGEFTAATVAGRRLLAEQTSAVVVVAVMSDKPVETAQKAIAIVESEAFKMSLAEMGYTLTETPAVYAYVNNELVAIPEAKEVNQADGSGDDDDSSSFPMWALAPIIIGGLAVVAAVVAGVMMMKKKKQQQQQQQQQQGDQALYAGVTATLTTPVSKV